MQVIIGGDVPLSVGKIEILNLYNAYEKRRIDTACKVIREATFEEYVTHLKTYHPGVRYPTNPFDFPYCYKIEIMD